MSIRQRIDEALVLARNGYYEAAMIIALVAIAGASRRRFPKGKRHRDIDVEGNFAKLLGCFDRQRLMS
jgi:hypothetical protein